MTSFILQGVCLKSVTRKVQASVYLCVVCVCVCVFRNVLLLVCKMTVELAGCLSSPCVPLPVSVRHQTAHDINLKVRGNSDLITGILLLIKSCRHRHHISPPHLFLHLNLHFPPPLSLSHQASDSLDQWRLTFELPHLFAQCCNVTLENRNIELVSKSGLSGLCSLYSKSSCSKQEFKQ